MADPQWPGGDLGQDGEKWEWAGGDLGPKYPGWAWTMPHGTLPVSHSRGTWDRIFPKTGVNHDHESWAMNNGSISATVAEPLHAHRAPDGPSRGGLSVRQSGRGCDSISSGQVVGQPLTEPPELPPTSLQHSVHGAPVRGS